MTRARNLAGLGTVTSSPTPVHIGPVGVITATRIDGEFGPRTDIEVRNLSAAGIAATHLQVSGITTGLNVSGIITAQNGINFNGTSTGLNVSGIGTIATLNVTGNATVGGVLTYEDVTNVDSVGIVTARGLSIFGNTTGLNVASGIATFLDRSHVGSTSEDRTSLLSNSALRGFPSDSAQTDRATFLMVAGNRRIGLGASSTAAWIQGSNPGSEGLGGKLTLNPGGGYVGINTASAPAYALDISGQTDTSIRLKATGTTSSDDTIMRFLIGGTTASNYIYFGDSGDTNAGQIRYSHNSDFMAFHTDASEAMRIDSNGRVLIGDTTTGNAFSGGDSLVIGNTSSNTRSGITLVSANDQDGGIYFSDGTSSGSANVQGQIVYDHNGTGMKIYTTADERMRITSGGYVNIGGNYTQTTYTAQVTGTFNATSDVLVNGKSAATAGKAIAMAMVFG